MEIAGYTITQCIAEGGMAAAYLAEQTSLGRTVVLKVLDTSVNDSRLALRRFMNEGQLLAALRHPNVITIYDIGTASNFVYISMEYVSGGDLKQRLADGPLAPDQALDILDQVARGLCAAHAEGIVHRDVKPGNVLFRSDGTPLLSDFGIAKSLVRDADLTATGVFLGSPNYMAPEQAEPGEIDTRTDIYALGVIFYEMLTGQKPYRSESVIEVIHMHKHAPIPRLPGDLAVFQGLLDLTLAKDRNDRFRDVPALQHYLSAVRAEWLSTTQELTAQEVMAPAPVTRLRWDSPPDRRWRLALYVLLVLALFGYGALYVIEADLAAAPQINDPGDLAQFTATQAALTQPSPTAAAAGAVDPATVISALLWLGNHCLNTQRLTLPPSDNAYYYFSRILQLEPSHVAARAGLTEVAKRYALLADGAVGRGDSARAQAYLAIGRQIDPQNEALRVIAELATPPGGIWSTLTRWLGRD
jgi:tRNA A-37 threonylcarbamoyl transferase component Bud32